MDDINLNQLRRQIARAKEYIDCGMKSRLKDMLQGVVEIETVEKWTKNFDRKNVSAPARRFYERMSNIPNAADLTRHDMYEVIASESGLEDPTTVLLPYKGVYDFVFSKDFPCADSFTPVGIGVYTKPTVFAGFKFNYRSTSKFVEDRRRVMMPHIYKCDGLVFSRGKRIYFAGTAENTTCLAYLSTVDYPDRRPLYGRLIFECIDEKVFVDTDFSIVKKYTSHSKECRTVAQSKLGSKQDRSV